MSFQFSKEQLETRKLLEDYHTNNPRDIFFQPCYEWLINEEDWRYGILSGGRASGKSVAGIDLSLLFATTASIELLFIREFQASIEKSSKAELENRINYYQLQDIFKITDTYVECTKTGSVYTFLGVNANPANIKSRSNVSFCFLEEAETIKADSLDIILPTIRRDDSIFIINFNPRLVTDPVHQQFVVSTPSGTRYYKLLTNRS